MTKIDQVIDNRYKIIKKIKNGGMGTIFLVEDQRLECKYIAKKLDWHKIDQEAEPEKIKEDFTREGKILANLKHPGLPKVQDIVIDDMDCYIIMEFIDGNDLAEIREKREVTEDEVVKWSIEILDILDYLHRQKPPIIFRDLKPSNIMLDNQNKVKLVDFGIARKIEERTRKLNNQTIIGTAGFAPIEQYQGKAEPRSDIYALGMTMHCLLTGCNPADEKRPLCSVLPKINPVLAEIIDKATQVNIDWRYTSAKEMKEALEEIYDQSTKISSLVIQDEKIAEKINTKEEMYASFIELFLNSNDYLKSYTVITNEQENELKKKIQIIQKTFLYHGLREEAMGEINHLIRIYYDPVNYDRSSSDLPKMWSTPPGWQVLNDREYYINSNHNGIYFSNEIVAELMTIQAKYLLSVNEYEKADSICQKIYDYKKVNFLESSDRLLEIWSEVKLDTTKEKENESLTTQKTEKQIEKSNKKQWFRVSYKLYVYGFIGFIYLLYCFEFISLKSALIIVFICGFIESGIKHYFLKKSNE